MKTKIQLGNMITVGALAEKLMIPVTKLIAELMKNGVMATVNENIDFDTAQIIVEELGLDIELEKEPEKELAGLDKIARAKSVSKNAQDRPPVVAVMGHVDHGKTSLLDAIRSADTTKHEAGGITQHISAYQIEHSGRQLTFLDTPGHEAFASLREHGAQLTDIVVIVVAADDGIKPQTIEAIRYAKKAGVKIIVAINKIDKTGADQNKVKQQLSEQGLLIEEWGGDITVVPVSAKTKEGIDKLLDMIILLSDIEELKADTDIPASGIVIEAHMEQGRGPIATVLVESGTLKKGEFVVVGTTYGKIRNLESTSGKPLTKATPSTPVIITGLKELPGFGDGFEVVDNEKTAKSMAAEATQNNQADARLGVDTSHDLMRVINRNMTVKELPVIVKADVKGSLTSVIDSLKTLENEEVSIRVVDSGVGTINENDLHRAKTGSAIIYGFNVDLPNTIKQHAARDKVSIRLYKVIYELIDDAKQELSTLLEPEVIETEKGTLLVKGVFKTTRNEVICGGEVTKGKLSLPAIVKVERDKKEIGEAEVTGLKKGQQETKEVLEGEMCGVQLNSLGGKLNLEEGDRLKFFTREVVARSL